jgi:ferredoxin--NADP+ reductase
MQRAGDRATQKKVDLLQDYARRASSGKRRRLILRFLVSPVEILDNGAGAVGGLRLVRNKLYATDTGTLQPKPTGEFEDLAVGLLFRSVGYKGVPLPGVPFNDTWGVILNEKGRVLDPERKEPVVGEYTAGWIKRGPTGVIGTNKPDAAETVACMVEDLAHDRHLQPASPSREAVERLIRERQPRCLSYQDWLRLNELEVQRGKETGRPRVKFTRIEDMLAALGRR